MARVIAVDQFNSIIGMKHEVATFDYNAWNAQQAAEHDRLEQLKARTLEQLAKEQRKRNELMAEHNRLKELYVKTGMDRRLSKKTRKQRQDDIVEAMINIEDLVSL